MTLHDLSRDWDVVVVGAGVAGSVTAYRLARRGFSVLLVEKSAWPRAKVCGGCLNAASLQALHEAGLEDVVSSVPVYSQLRLASGKRQAVLELPVGRALSRRILDARLVEHAIDAGTCFLPETHAVLENTQDADADAKAFSREWRPVVLANGTDRVTLKARLVIGADGLGSRLLHGDSPKVMHVDVDKTSRIGLGTTLDNAPDFYHPGTIHMACGRHGYVGLVRVEEGRLSVGAALDPAWVKQCGGASFAVAQLLQTSGFALFDSLYEANWQGTPRMKRSHPCLGGERLLLVGDAAGYVEPFTGEGMGWALASAAAVEPLALDAIQQWQPGLVRQWTARHARIIGKRQRTCRRVSVLLRHPRLMATLLPLVNAVPTLAAPLTIGLNRRYRFSSKERK
ncbi:NAD(P)/FAD-dependent oxidoreductase [Vreelandella rituensis]|uniref:Protein CbrA n=1 Tax=Vreelandella rituensis TaxID=2282306 RepID=A0A368U6H9_9GAMM|nr:NAD(P)/FAD-dependent oxidoreductase [Halomonas rituensis]RCV92769.1 NAD(P)/FAD-dependent oxidoreductase [Halomonas rituensis]